MRRDLIHGIREFRQHVFPGCRERFETLAGGQRPSTLFITCSDSRIVPEMLTQTGPGELFVLRNAGNLVPPYGQSRGGEAATIEYAVKVLKVEQIVVCGHSHCGAVTGLLRPETLTDLPMVEEWLKNAETTRREILEQTVDRETDGDLLTRAIQCNVAVQIRHLRTYPAVAEAELRGAVTLHGWFYRFEEGDLLVQDPATESFASIFEPALENIV